MLMMSNIFAITISSIDVLNMDLRTEVGKKFGVLHESL